MTGEAGPLAPAAAEPAEFEMPTGLAAKLSWVMGQVGRVPKNGWNDFHKYKYVMEPDLVAALTEHLSRVHVMLYSEVEEIEEVRTVSTQRGADQVVTRVWIRFTFVDGDNPDDSRSVRWPGEGADSIDKGLYKAITGAEKYFLLKQFLVSSGEANDPEFTPAESAAPATRTRSTPAQRQERKPAEPVEEKPARPTHRTEPDGTETRLVSDPQMRALHAAAKQIGWDHEDLRVHAKLATLTDLTFDGAREMIKGLGDLLRAQKLEGRESTPRPSGEGVPAAGQGAAPGPATAPSTEPAPAVENGAQEPAQAPDGAVAPDPDETHPDADQGGSAAGLPDLDANPGGGVTAAQWAHLLAIYGDEGKIRGAAAFFFPQTPADQLTSDQALHLIKTGREKP